MATKQLIHSLIIGFILLFPRTSVAIDDKYYQFAHIDKNNGLINNQINSFLCDSHGFMWFGTADGLSKWDGYQFTNYSSLTGYQQFTSNNVATLQEDADGHIWIKVIGRFLMYDESTEEISVSQLDTCTGFPKDNVIEDIFIDKKKNMFVITDRSKLLYREKGALWFRNFDIPHSESDKILSIKGNDNTFWILHQSGLLQQLDLKSQRITQEITELRDRFSNIYEFRHYVDKDGDIWVYSFNPTIGAWRYITSESRWVIYNTSSPIPLLVNEVNTIEQADDGRIWIGTDHGGIHIFDKQRNEITYIQNDPKDSRSLCHNAITSLYCDEKGIVWIGTFKKGIDYYHKSICKFTRMGNQKTTSFPALPYEDINCFAEDKKGNLWIGTNGGGLLCYSPNNKEIKSYRHNPNNPHSISSDIIISLYFDRDERLWISTWLGGLCCMEDGKFVSYKHNDNDPHSIPANSIWYTMQDSRGQFWIATFKGGICQYDGKNKFTPIEKIFTKGQIYNSFATRIIQIDKDLLMSGHSAGLYYLNLVTKEITQIDGKGNIPFIHNINTLFLDSRGLIWVTSDNGLYLFDRQQDSMRKFLVKDGLCSNSIKSITEDSNHNIWVTSLNGISCIAINVNHAGEYVYTFENFTASDGLQSDEFNQNAILRCKNNELLFGGPQGISIYKPNNVMYNATLPYPKFTNFQLSGQNIQPGDTVNNRILLEKSICQTKHITLKYYEKNFTICFSALSYLQPEKIKYRYRLVDFNDDWIEVMGKIHQATYTNLAPGDYKMEVIASNSDGAWNAIPATLQITILPPFWKTWIAIVMYLLIIVSFIYLIYRNIRNKIRRTTYEQQIKNKHDMDEMRLRFFTNMSHEFRTPLSLIISPCESMLKEERNEEDDSRLQIMLRNAHQLLDLVNKLLDFRKLDKNAHVLNARVGDIIQCIQNTCRGFSDIAYSRGIHYTYSSSVKSLFMEYDEEKMDSVLLNLLSNAFKFTEKNGNINVNVDVVNHTDNGLQLIIKVSDTGVGIKAADVEHIFDRFYQASLPNGVSNNGSGIGLNLVKEFVNLHHGTICVESIEKQGSTFTVSIPVTSNVKDIQKDETGKEISLVETQHHESEKIEIQGNEDSSQHPLILVVDDNVDFRKFIGSSLQKENYRIIEAPNGAVAWNYVREKTPDLIISDVMMPEMDGIELCEHVRKDKDFAQLPIILLTAKASEESKIEGFETGADYYITKPFKMELLLLHIQKLLAQSSNTQGQNSGTIQLKTSNIDVKSLDEQLVERAIDIVEQRMEESGFSVEELSKELSMSRVHLYKKLLTLTGKSPIEFIRIVRLRRAAQLLEKSQLTVAEIAYQVGFNNPKYFSRHFKDEYGILPSEYAKKSNPKN